jgi:hypothetical protein
MFRIVADILQFLPSNGSCRYIRAMVDKVICPVNIHPLFLFWKHGSVCDPEKIQVQNMDLKKARWKKQGHCNSKREEARLSLLFLNNNDPVFCSLLFSGPCFGLYFVKVPGPKKISGQPDKLE